MSNKELYTDICRRQYVPLFYQPWWLDAVSDDWDAVIEKKNEQANGIFPYTIEQKVGVSILRNPMFTPYTGPHVFYPFNIKESNRDSYEHKTISALLQQLPKSNVWHIALQPGIKQAGLFKNYGLQVQVQQTFLIDLSQPEDVLLANMKDDVRANIKLAKNGITITNEPKHLPELYNYYINTLTKKDKKAHYQLAKLQKIMDACQQNNAAALWVAKAGNEIQGIIWHGWDEQRSYYLMSGLNPSVKSSIAIPGLLWHAIKEAKEKGHMFFDMEGSMDAGVEKFFRGFGGKRELYMVLSKNDSLLWKIKKTLIG